MGVEVEDSNKATAPPTASTTTITSGPQVSSGPPSPAKQRKMPPAAEPMPVFSSSAELPAGIRRGLQHNSRRAWPQADAVVSTQANVRHDLTMIMHLLTHFQTREKLA